MQFRSVEGKAYTFHRTLQSHTLLLENQEWFYVIMHIAPEVVAGTHLPSYACYKLFFPFDSCWGRLQPGLDASSVLSLSEDCLMNNPQSRASLDYLMVNIKSLQI